MHVPTDLAVAATPPGIHAPVVGHRSRVNASGRNARRSSDSLQCLDRFRSDHVVAVAMAELSVVSVTRLRFRFEGRAVSKRFATVNSLWIWRGRVVANKSDGLNKRLLSA